MSRTAFRGCLFFVSGGFFFFLFNFFQSVLLPNRRVVNRNNYVFIGRRRRPIGFRLRSSANRLSNVVFGVRFDFIVRSTDLLVDLYANRRYF